MFGVCGSIIFFIISFLMTLNGYGFASWMWMMCFGLMLHTILLIFVFLSYDDLKRLE